MDTPRKEEDTVPPFLPAEDFSTGVFDLAQRDDHLLGTIVAGRYTVMRLLGHGGMGRVYEAFDAAQQREVAIKVLSSDRIGSPAAVQRFMEEARVLSMLSHPNVVRLLDFGQDDTGVVFMVMEMLVGRDLGDHLADRRRLPWSEASEIALQLVRGLSAAHDRGIVHRDLKPENVFLVQVPQGALPKIKLLDFGIAKDVQSHNAKLTGEGSVFGTARYMSPEQASGSPVDARSDVYGVGVLIYEMITGRPPFPGDDFLRTAHQHITDPVPPLSEVAPDVPFHPLVEEMVMRALAKRREDRFASMFDFEAAIEGTTFESTMAILMPRRPEPRPAPRAPAPTPVALSLEEHTVIRPPPIDERARPPVPVPVPVDRTAAIGPPEFDDEHTAIRPPMFDLPPPPPASDLDEHTVIRPPAAMMPPPPAAREERTVVRAAPMPEPRPRPRPAPPLDERTVIRPSPLGVAGTIVPLTQPPSSAPPPPSPPLQMPMSPFEESNGDTVAMQIPMPMMEPPPRMPAGVPYPMQGPSVTPLATPVVRLPPPAVHGPAPLQGAPPPLIHRPPAPLLGAPPPVAHRPPAPLLVGGAPPPPMSASPSLGGLVGGPGAGWSGGGLAGLPMPAGQRDSFGGGGGGLIGNESQPVFAREENAAFMPAHLAPTRLAAPPSPSRNISPEEALATPFRPRNWAADEPSGTVEASWSGVDSGEMLLRLPQRETSRNLVVAIVILTIVGLGLVGLLVWAMTRDPEPADQRPYRASTAEQPRAIAPPPEPKRPLVIKDTEPEPRPRPKPAPEPVPEPEPEPVPEPEPYDPEPSSRPSRPRPSPGPSSGPVLTLSTAQLDTGFKKARSSINACAKKNGALEGTNLQISFDVVDGRATNIKVQPPYGPTPLGRCVAAAVDANARFAAAKEPSRAVSRKVSF